VNGLKILVVGSDQTWSLERIYIKHLIEEGADVGLFAAQNIFYSYNKSILNKLKFRAGLSGIYKVINTQLRQKVEQFQPGIVWVFKGMEVMPETLEWIRRKGIKIVNYNPDNPFIFSGRGSGNSHVSQAIPLYDLHFTYNLEVKKRLEEEFGLRTAFLPFGFELPEATFRSAIGEPELSRLCFLGNPDRQRAALITALVNAGLSVDLYGNDWEKFVRQHPDQRIFPAVYGDEFWMILRRYRVQLNLMRVHNLNSHNMRSFEVPGIGGIMLAPDTVEHRLFFRDKEEVFLFAEPEEAIQKAKFILSLDNESAGKIRHQVRKRSLDDGYTYLHRVKEAITELKGLYA
jgi:spore maturation protein CgeB